MSIDWDAQPVTADGVEHSFRAYILRSLAQQHGITIFVETGTALGGTLEQLHGDFAELYSVELDSAYHEYAQNHVGKAAPNVYLTHADSTTWVQTMVEALTEPALFYLDAHYSGPHTAKGKLETPIKAELRAILESPVGHVVVVDDARLFGVAKDYPTIDWVCDYATRLGYCSHVAADQITIWSAAE